MGGTETLNSVPGWMQLGLAALVVLVLLAMFVRLVRYRLSRHEFEVLLGGMVVRRVYLKDIDQVATGGRFPAEYWPSWTGWGRGSLTIRRKHGLLRRLVVTPENPEAMRVNLYYALGWKP